MIESNSHQSLMSHNVSASFIYYLSVPVDSWKTDLKYGRSFQVGKDRWNSSIVWQGSNGSLYMGYLSKELMWQEIGGSPI